VVGEVAADDVDEGVDADRAVAGDAGSGPGLTGKAAEEGKRGQANGAKLVHQIGPRCFISFRAGDGDLLVETRQRISEPAGKPQCPAEKDSFAIADVV